MSIVSAFVYSKSAKLLFHQHREGLCPPAFVSELVCGISLHCPVVVNGPFFAAAREEIYFNTSTVNKARSTVPISVFHCKKPAVPESLKVNV